MKGSAEKEMHQVAMQLSPVYQSKRALNIIQAMNLCFDILEYPNKCIVLFREKIDDIAIFSDEILIGNNPIS